MLYQINDLRVVVETAKRLLTKEQMNKKVGQATTSPFMQVSLGNSKNKTEKNEKKVSFSTVEVIERTTDSIERLAYLMDKMDTKLDRREDQYIPRVYQGRGRGMGYRENNYQSRNRSYSRDRYQNNYRGRGNYNKEVAIEITDPIIGIIVGPMIETTTEMVVGTIIDQIIEGMTVTIGMVTEIRTVVDPDRGIEIGEIGVAQEKVPNPGVIVYPKTETRVGDRVEVMPEIETGLSQDPDHLLV